jgi:hypothetical protein
MASPREWYRDGFLVSDRVDLLQRSAINEAFGSDILYWTKAMSQEQMEKLLSKSLCFGVYALPQSTAEIAGIAFYLFLTPTTLSCV